MAKITGWQVSLSEMVMFGAMWATLAAAIPLVGQGGMNGVFLATAVLATMAVFEAVQPLPAAAQFLDQSLAAARRLFALVDTRPEVAEPVAPCPCRKRCTFSLWRPVFGMKRPLCQPFLTSISTSNQGGKLALWGQAGRANPRCSTCCFVFGNGMKGEILLNGRSVRQYDPDAIRACFSVVSQRAHLFNASIYDNLRLAEPQADRETIFRAAKAPTCTNLSAACPRATRRRWAAWAAN
ncbi:MAG: hypothetical protein M5U34_03590 [Chloroflexi bacterium]|nr:hypothetical protein [Chloroflexota bacterium]